MSATQGGPPEAFGNAIGNSIVEASRPKPAGATSATATGSSSIDPQAEAELQQELAAEEAARNGAVPSSQAPATITANRDVAVLNYAQARTSSSGGVIQLPDIQLQPGQTYGDPIYHGDGPATYADPYANPALGTPVAIADPASVAASEPAPGLTLDYLKYLGANVGHGAASAAMNMVYQPIAQLHDLGQIGYGVYYNSTHDDLYQPNYWSAIGQQEMAGGVSDWQRLANLAASNPITGVGPAAFNLTTAGINGDYGSLAEQAGGLVAGFALGKAVDAFGTYNIQLPVYLRDPEPGVLYSNPIGLRWPLAADLRNMPGAVTSVAN